MRGLNVTLPHKQAAAELVNELTPRAERAGAVNTIAFFEDTALLGDNTDGLGLTADLERNLGMTLTDKRVLILGAGGAVRGVLGPLLERELREVHIANRTPDRARKLATEFADMGQISGCGYADLRGPAYDLIINATSASLQGDMPQMPAGIVGEETVCYDMAYGRGHTPFTLWAKIVARGARHQGLGDADRTGGRVVSCSGAASAPIPSPSCKPWRITPEPAGPVARGRRILTHRHQLFRAGRVNRDRVVEVALGRAHADGHRESLQHFVGAGADDMAADDFLFGAPRIPASCRCASCASSARGTGG